MTNWTEEHVELLGGKIHVLKGGSGDPMVVLHRDNGSPGVTPFLEEMAKQFTVHVSTYAGYDNSEPESYGWMVTVRDLAIAQQQLIHRMGLAPVTVVGLGYGGWLAAEIATMSAKAFKQIILVAPMGIQPKEGEIMDQFILNTENYVRSMFYDITHFEKTYGALPEFDWLERWETNREMTSRIGWKPYMYNRAMANLMSEVTVPALVVWGREDGVVPLECGQVWADALPNAKLRILDQCGHAVDLEKPQDLAKEVLAFAGKG